MKIGHLVSAALKEAATEKCSHDAHEPDDPTKRNRARSQYFVACLAGCLRRAHESSDIAVMSKDYPHSLEERARIRRQFGMQELLFDISVFQFDNVTSIKGQNLVFLKRGLWIIESEMARNSRQALYDFNKLVLGNAQNMLFIGPQLEDPKRHGGYLRVMKAPARRCASAPYLALIPHPDSWTIDTRSVKLYSWQGEDWSDDLGPFT